MQNLCAFGDIKRNKKKCEARALAHLSFRANAKCLASQLEERKKPKTKTRHGKKMKSKRSSSTNGGGVSEDATNKKRFNFFK